MSDTVHMAKSKSKKLAARETRDDRVTFRCPPRLRAAIEAAALQDHRSVSDWVVLALTRVTSEEV
jgi:predicted HicB family RNase H-like nuclease